jgi:hypothetical protein
MVLGGGLPASAFPLFEEAARPMGARDCTFCHSTSHGTGWNKRGQWLIREKTRRNAERVDIEWLKDYRPPKATRHAKRSWTRRRTKPSGAPKASASGQREAEEKASAAQRKPSGDQPSDDGASQSASTSPPEAAPAE